MKRIQIVSAVAIIAVAVMVSSCGSSREYGRSYPGGPRPGFSLVLSAGPGMMIMRNPNGLYYYRDPGGYIYWRGYDNRYYLDRKYVNRSYYHHQQYNDWRHYNNGRRRR